MKRFIVVVGLGAALGGLTALLGIAGMVGLPAETAVVVVTALTALADFIRTEYEKRKAELPPE